MIVVVIASDRGYNSGMDTGRFGLERQIDAVGEDTGYGYDNIFIQAWRDGLE